MTKYAVEFDFHSHRKKAWQVSLTGGWIRKEKQTILHAAPDPTKSYRIKTKSKSQKQCKRKST